MLLINIILSNYDCYQQVNDPEQMRLSPPYSYSYQPQVVSLIKLLVESFLINFFFSLNSLFFAREGPKAGGKLQYVISSRK